VLEASRIVAAGGREGEEAVKEGAGQEAPQRQEVSSCCIIMSAHACAGFTQRQACLYSRCPASLLCIKQPQHTKSRCHASGRSLPPDLAQISSIAVPYTDSQNLTDIVMEVADP